ncbi:hypothetical protein ETAA8_03630 [Anatilimnocola aggregata]|uniref:Uncharacterized protein n=1 Tax=Anatilimnocola aggregata TaxID=2528021 RepID=A0A517Y4X6_9BACT|nr:hypothetical protein [Anatilimnocola aggregata]QDU25299.1 hypothetical protein ETAA8_03630 [Anatilimnocola aggregata]
MTNPYESPVSASEAPAESPITDALIVRMIAGEETREVLIEDVSDVLLYGRKHSCKLTGSVAQTAMEAGFEPVAYQSVLWWCVISCPLIPLSTCIVLTRTDVGDVGGEAYRVLPIARDSSQIATHFAFTLGFLLGAMILLPALIWLGWRLMEHR